MPQSYDIIIVGGGPAGAIAALVAARRGWRTLLLEESHYQDFKIGESLPPAANLLLQDLGLLDDFLVGGHLPCYGNISAWGGDALDCVDFINDPHGHGWHLDRRRFDRFLCEKAESAGAVIQTKSVFRRAAFDKSNAVWQISLTVNKGNETSISCRWLVDASRRSSVVARRNAAKRQAKDKLVAFLGLFAQTDICNNIDEDSRTLVEAVSDGWWYSALVPGVRRIVVFHTDGDLTRPNSSALKTPSGFVSALKNAAHLSRLISRNDYRLLAPPQMKVACSARLDNFCGKDGWLAVGDAAMSFDPISSQGITTALYTGMRAGEILDARLTGKLNSLETYDQNLNIIFDAYVKNLSACYAVETRWSDSLFWTRRNPI